MLTSTGIHQRGVGLVELMVGITIGLIVAAGASLIAVNQINEHRRLMLETQLEQDLRTAADLLVQDLRRAGFRGNPANAVWAPPQTLSSLANQSAATATPNPYAAVSTQGGDSTLTYSYARQQRNDSYDTTDVVKSNEYAGIKWDASAMTLSLKLGNGADGQPNWQPITDPAVVQITDFSAVVTAHDVSAGEFCDSPCGTGALPACPLQRVREVRFRIAGTATHDRTVLRTFTGVERVKADALVGACPT